MERTKFKLFKNRPAWLLIISGIAGIFLIEYHYEQFNFPSALQFVGALSLFFLIIKLLGRFGLIDLENLNAEMEHSQRVNQLAEAKLAFLFTLVAMVLPLPLLLLFSHYYSIQSDVFPWLGLTLTLAGIFMMAICIRYVSSRVGRLFVSVIFLAGICYYWYSVYSQFPSNLIGISWVIGLMLYGMTTSMLYKYHLEKITPRE